MDEQENVIRREGEGAGEKGEAKTISTSSFKTCLCLQLFRVKNKDGFHFPQFHFNSKGANIVKHFLHQISNNLYD